MNPDLASLIESISDLYEDLDFQTVRDWKAQDSGRQAIGYMPIYVPHELIHAAGMLPVGILGAGATTAAVLLFSLVLLLLFEIVEHEIEQIGEDFGVVSSLSARVPR